MVFIIVHASYKVIARVAKSHKMIKYFEYMLFSPIMWQILYPQIVKNIVLTAKRKKPRELKMSTNGACWHF